MVNFTLHGHSRSGFWKDFEKALFYSYIGLITQCGRSYSHKVHILIFFCLHERIQCVHPYYYLVFWEHLSLQRVHLNPFFPSWIEVVWRIFQISLFRKNVVQKFTGKNQFDMFWFKFLPSSTDFLCQSIELNWLTSEMKWLPCMWHFDCYEIVNQNDRSRNF